MVLGLRERKKWTMDGEQEKIAYLEKMMALAGYELYPKDAKHTLKVLALAVSGLVDQGKDVDGACDVIFGT